jgi:hypothetical protein
MDRNIEVSDEMIEAGGDIIAKYWVELTTSPLALSAVPDLVTKIYVAMEAARVVISPTF